MTTEDIIYKLNSLLGKGNGEHDVSPTSTPGRGLNTLSSALYVHKDIDVETLSENDLILLHTLLHKFYASGHKVLSNEDIEALHIRVKNKINHHDFDKLDRK